MFADLEAAPNVPPRRAVLPMLLEHRPTMIARMFDSIADRYDDLDHLLSAGLDEHWRTVVISQLRLTGHEAVLDLCAGTGDVALRLRGAGARSVAAVDFAPAMLRIARAKSRSAGIDGIQFLCADAQHIPLRTASIAAATMAFGLRNVEQPIAVITELHRVLRPGGRLVILELSKPSTAIRRPYLAYFRHILPWIGRLVSRNPDAYRYLPSSVDAFPPPAQIAEMLTTACFEHVHVIPLSQGIAHCYTARKPRTGMDAKRG